MRKDDGKWPWRRRLLWTGAALALLLAVAWIVVSRMARSHLVAAAEKNLHLTLHADHIWYLPPLGIDVRGLLLTAPKENGPPVEVARADEVRVTLLEIPRSKGPVRLDRLLLKRPVASLVHNPSGWSLPGEVAPTQAQRESREIASKRPSDLFSIRQLSIEDGSITCRNETPNGGDTSRLDGIKLQATRQKSTSNYDISLTAGTTGTQLSGKGSFDLDSLLLKVDSMSARLDGRDLPGSILGDGTRLSGAASVEARGYFPLRQISKSSASGTIGIEQLEFAKASSAFPVRDGKLNLMVRISESPVGSASRIPMIVADVQALQTVVGGASLDLTSGSFTTTADGQSWQAHNIAGTVKAIEGEASGSDASSFVGRNGCRGSMRFVAAGTIPFRFANRDYPLDECDLHLIAYPRDMAFKPKKFGSPIEHINTGSAELRGSVVILKNLVASCGQDRLALSSARFVLHDRRRQIAIGNLRNQLRFEEIGGLIDFHAPQPVYPAAIAKVMEQLRPTGQFGVAPDSWYVFNLRHQDEPPKKPEYFIRMASQDATFEASKYRVKISNIRSNFLLTPKSIDVYQVNATAMQGSVSAQGQIKPAAPLHFSGNATLADIDCAELVRAFNLKQPRKGKINGKGFANLTFAGGAKTPEKTALQQLQVDAQCQIVGGDFYTLPVFTDVLDHVHHTEQVTLGQAAALVHVADEKVTFQDALVAAPAIGLQGSGTIGFDKSLDLHAVAMPLGDWRANLAQVRVPVLSDVAAEIVGAMQKVFGAAQGVLLYELRIDGTLTKPELHEIPAPAFTDGIALLFGQLVKNGGQQPLTNLLHPAVNIDAVRKEAEGASGRAGGK